MTTLLPEAIRHAVHSRSDYAASDSFGVVALVLFLLLLAERELLQVLGVSRRRVMTLTAVTLPLAVAVTLTLWIRVADLLP